MKHPEFMLVACLCLLLAQTLSGGILTREMEAEAITPESALASSAASWYVSTTGNDLTGAGTIGNPFRTIQHAVDLSASGDFIYIVPGVYEEHVKITSKSLTLRSSNTSGNAFIYSDTSRCLTALHCPSLYLYRLQFEGRVTTPMQNSGGAVRIEDGTGVLRKCIISNSSAPHNGGGLYAIDAILTIDSCEITGNEARWEDAPYDGMENRGGGICYWGDYLSISNSTIAENYCGKNDAYGGGVWVNGMFASIVNSDIYGNTAEAVRTGVQDGHEAMGGGICIEGDESVISGCRIYDNTATARTELTGARCFGGGVSTVGQYSHFYYNLVFHNQVIGEFWEGYSEVFIEADGGGVYLQGTMCTNNTIDDNYAIARGELHYDYCDITLVAIGGGAVLDNCEVYYNIFSYNEVSTELSYYASCQPGCASFCDRFLTGGSGVSEGSSNDICNIYYGNTGATEWSGPMSGTNFNLDPQYCDRVNRNYYVNTASPALPINNSCGQQIGARADGCEAFVDGDANGDAQVNVADAVYLINFVFKQGPAPEPLEAGDANCDLSTNVADAVYLINYVFKGGPEPGCR